MTKYYLIDSLLNIVSINERELAETIKSLDFEKSKLIMVQNHVIYEYVKTNNIITWVNI